MTEPKTPTGRRIADLVAKAEDEAIETAVAESARGYDRKLEQIERAAKLALSRGDNEGASFWRDGLVWIRKLAEPEP